MNFEIVKLVLEEANSFCIESGLVPSTIKKTYLDFVVGHFEEGIFEVIY